MGEETSWLNRIVRRKTAPVRLQLRGFQVREHRAIPANHGAYRASGSYGFSVRIVPERECPYTQFKLVCTYSVLSHRNRSL